jgi:hypothetical protein
MSVAEQISRIQQDRNRIRNKLNALGLANGTDTLDTLTEAIEKIQDNGSITAQVKEGETYTIPAGFHSGTGTVSGVKGGGNYTLQSKTVTPTKQHQVITPDEGSYGLSDVQVNPIPDAYQDVTSVTAGAENVLTGKVFVDKEGTIVAGTMPNNGSVVHELATDDFAEDPLGFTIPAGYHDGTGRVFVTKGTFMDVTPMKVPQECDTTLFSFTVLPIPDEYQDVTEVNAVAAEVLANKKIVAKDGSVVTGTMKNNGIQEITLNPEQYPDGWVNLEGYYAPGSLVGIVDQDLGTITPTKQQIIKEEGFAHVIVEAIPDAYQDVTVVDATAAEVLSGKKIVNKAGEVVTGTMANNGSVTASIDGITVTSVTIPAGYTAGGTISLTSDIEDQLALI